MSLWHWVATAFGVLSIVFALLLVFGPRWLERESEHTRAWIDERERLGE